MASTESKAGDAAAAEKTPAVVAAEAFVREHLAANDASHDYAHIERVRNTALRLAREEGVEDLEVVELAAVLHDIYDHKYSGSETAGPEAALAFCLEHGCGEERSARVAFIIKHVGFSKEIAGGDAPKPEENLDLAVVQDADRLDAIGAIGIARCFTYGGAKKRPLWDDRPVRSDEELRASYGKKGDNSSSVNHFYEKLLKLRGLMKTSAGRATADRRHAVMEAFLEQFKAEWRGEA